MSVFTYGFQNGSSPSIVGGTGTTIKYFPVVPGPSIGVASTTTLQLDAPGANRLNGQKFTVDVTGETVTDPTIACPTINITLAAVTLTGTGSTSGMLANPIVLGTLGATAAGNTFGDVFQLTASFYGGNFSAILAGSYTASLNGVNVRSNTATTVLTGINFNQQLNNSVANAPSGPPFTFVVGVTFGTSGANNKAYLYQLALSS